MYFAPLSGSAIEKYLQTDILPSMSTILPINAMQQKNVITLVDNYIECATNLFQKKFPPINVLFDLKGRAAGMYKIDKGSKKIRFNPYHFAKHPEENFTETIPHEVAHYIIDQLYGIRNVRPHGKEWQSLMLKFGVEPKRTFSYSLDGIPTRTHKRHTYTCGCMQFEITTRRHNMIQQGKAKYSCRQCGDKIKFLQNAIG